MTAPNGVASHHRLLPVRFPLFALLLLCAGIGLWRWSALRSKSPEALNRLPLARLQALCARDKSDFHACYSLGLRLSALGQESQAQVAFGQAAELNPDDASLWIAWAKTVEGLKVPSQAVHILASYLNRHPNCAEAHLALAHIYHRGYAHRESYREAEACARLMPSNAEPWRLMGKDALQMQQFSETEAAWRQAVALDQRDWATYMDLGDLCVRLHREREAADYYRQAAHIAPQQAVTHRALGEVLLHSATTSADIKNAEDSIERSLRLDASSAKTYVLLGEARMRQARWHEADDAFQQIDRLPEADLVTQRTGVFRRMRLCRILHDQVGLARLRTEWRGITEYQTAKSTLLDTILTHPNDVSRGLLWRDWLRAIGKSKIPS